MLPVCLSYIQNIIDFCGIISYKLGPLYPFHHTVDTFFLELCPDIVFLFLLLYNIFRFVLYRDTIKPSQKLCLRAIPVIFVEFIIHMYLNICAHNQLTFFPDDLTAIPMI